MKNHLQEFDEIWDDYLFQRKTLKLFRLNVKLALKGTVGLSASLLRQSDLQGFTMLNAQETAKKAEQALADSTVLSLWIVFERCLTAHLQGFITLSASTRLTEMMNVHIQEDIERWKMSEKLDMTESLLNAHSHPNLVGNLKQIKNYRDWVAHRNPNIKPTNISPEDAYQYLREALQVIITS